MKQMRMLNMIERKDSTKGDWSSGMIPVLGTGGPGFNSRIAPFFTFTTLIQLNKSSWSLTLCIGFNVDSKIQSSKKIS